MINLRFHNKLLCDEWLIKKEGSHSDLKKETKAKKFIKLTVPELQDLKHSFASAQGGMLNDSVKTFLLLLKTG